MGGEDVSDRWRLSRAEARRLAVLSDALAEGTTTEEVAHRHGAEVALDLALVRAARDEPPPADLDAALARAADAEFPLRAADLIPECQGPALGAALRRAEAAWIASGFELSRDELKRVALSA